MHEYVNNVSKYVYHGSNVLFLGVLSKPIVTGFTMEDPQDFAKRMYRMMQKGLSLETLELLEPMEVPEEEEEEEEEEDDDELDFDLDDEDEDEHEEL